MKDKLESFPLSDCFLFGGFGTTMVESLDAAGLEDGLKRRKKRFRGTFLFTIQKLIFKYLL